MRAAAYIRFAGGEGFGHVAWAFEWSARVVGAGAVENYTGHFHSHAEQMGFWSAFFDDPTPHMRLLEYDDVKCVEVANANPVAAYRTVLWIREQPFWALNRNCLDYAYDVLRAYGVCDLPSHRLLPADWFAHLRGTLAHVADFGWRGPRVERSAEQLEPVQARLLEPLEPPWR